MSELRMGVVGVGALGRHHARILSGMEGVRLVAVSDLRRETVEPIAAKCGCTAVCDYREMLDRVDAAVIAVPTFAHLAVARDFLQRGLPVLVEKPLALNVAESRQLVELAEANGALLQVGHIERFNPAVVAVLPLVTEPKFIEAHRLGVFVPRALDVDVVLDLLVHDLDIALEIVKRPVTAIHAVGVPILSKKVDIASIRIEFEGGCVANLTASRVSTEKTRKFRFFQPDWYFSIDTQAREVKAYRLDRMSGPPRITEWPLDVVPADPLTSENGAFLEACRARTEPAVTGEAGRAALKLALDVQEEVRRRLG
jgi:predicted dehydrogenase